MRGTVVVFLEQPTGREERKEIPEQAGEFACLDQVGAA